MEKTRLLELLKSEPSDIDAIGMILSNYTDYGHSELGGMVSVKKFNEVAECLLEWWDGKNTPTSQEQLATPDVSVAKRKVCPKCGETKDIEHVPDHYDCHSCGEEF